MKYHVLPRMACGCAILVFAFAHCGCQSTKSGGGWASAFRPKPKEVNSNDTEVVTYWPKKKSKPAPNVDELREKMARGADSSESSRIYAEHIRVGIHAMRAKRWAEARSEFEKALVARPDDADCHHRLAVVADNESQFGVADDHYEAALRQRPRDSNLLSDFGFSYLLRGDNAQAEKTLNRALAITPSHKGAMANLGAIYARQGRYDEALAMFRRGGTEAEAQQYIAELFPQNGAPVGNTGRNALAQNAANGSPRTPAAPDRPDFKKMTPDQLRAEMERARLDSIQKRQQQIIAESQTPRDWTTETPPSRTNDAALQSSQPLILGNGGSSQTPGNPAQSQAMQNPQYGMNNPSYGTAAPQGTNNSGGQFPSQNGFAPPGSNNGIAVAMPGTNPNVDLWQGAPIQNTGGVQNQYPTPTPNAPNAMASGGGQFNSSPNFGSQPPRSTMPNPSAGINWGGTDTPGQSPQGGTSATGSPSQEGVNASTAAAQLGMNVGPGGLFPVASADASTSQGFGSQGFGSQGFGSQGNGSQGFGTNGSPSFPSRLGGGNFPAPQQSQPFQSQGPQFAPPTLPNPPLDSRHQQLDPRQAASPNFNTSQGFAAAPSNGTTNSPNAWGSPSSLPSIAPPSISTLSPASDWPQQENPSAVIQAGGSSAGQARSGTPDAMDSFQSEMNAGMNSRRSNSGWGDSNNSTPGSAGPYNGSWPPNNNSIPSNGSHSDWSGNGTQRNSPPPWNGGAAANSIPQNSFGPAASNGSSVTIEPWAHAPQ